MVAGYVFYIQDDELHFHPREFDQAPLLTLEYFTETKGLLRSFKPATQSQGAKGAAIETKAVGVDPRKSVVEHKANNATMPERTSLGKQTYLVDGNTGEGRFKDQETGQVVPSFERSEGFYEELRQEPAQDAAEAKFREAELRQVEADAVTIGIPQLRAEKNIEVIGVGQKFSDIYYCQSVPYNIEPGGYACELRLKKNALGKGACDKFEKAQGKPYVQQVPPTPQQEPPTMVTVDANTGVIAQKGGGNG